MLRHLNITHVLTIEAHRLPKSTFEDTNISTLFIRAYDTPQTHLLPYFPMANAFIDEGVQKGYKFYHKIFLQQNVRRSTVTEVDYVFYILRKHYRPLPLRSLAISNPGHRLSHGKVPTDLRASLRVRETKTQVHQPELRLREPAEGIPAAQLRR